MVKRKSVIIEKGNAVESEHKVVVEVILCLHQVRFQVAKILLETHMYDIRLVGSRVRTQPDWNETFLAIANILRGKI